MRVAKTRSRSSSAESFWVAPKVKATVDAKVPKTKTLAKAPQLSSPGKTSAKMALFVLSYLKKHSG